MAVTDREMIALCESLLAGRDAAPELTLADYLRAVPGMAELDKLPSGTTVLVRGDVDAKAKRRFELFLHRPHIGRFRPRRNGGRNGRRRP